MANTSNEVFIPCGWEENVIDIESDASTMTGDTVSSKGTKRSQNYVVETSDLKSVNLLKKKPRKSNLIELISEQRNGSKPSYAFSSNMMALKNNRLKSTNIFTTVHPEVHVSDCEYIRSVQDGCILGVWKGDQYDTILYKLALNLSPRGSSVEDDTPNFLKSIERIGPFFSKSDIKDICDTNCRNQKYVLYVGSYLNEDLMKQSSAVLCGFANSSTTAGKQYISMRELLSCCGSQNNDVFATGSEEGVFIYQDQEFIFHNQYIGTVNSVEFNSAGNILYCGIHNSGITIFDKREAPWKNSTIRVMNISSGISETKLFSNENNMVVSGFDGTLSQIDLRKRETVLSYPGHEGGNKKIPFSLSEHPDILCATGADKLTRLWSLRTGSHLCTIEPHIKGKKVHSCLVVDEYRWSVAIFQKNRMCILEPES